MAFISGERLGRIGRTIRQSPKTSLLCACKKVELKLLGKHASGHAYNMPVGMDIELTNVCNLQCPWCDTQFYADKSIKKREIPFEVYQQIAPKLKGLNRVMFCGGGETLTYKHAAEAVALTKQYVPTVLMHSNGVLLRGARAEALARSGLDSLRISIDGSDEETFQQVRGTSLKKIMENLKYFSSVCDVPISTVSVISKTNWRSLLGVPDMLSEVGNVRHVYFQPVEVDFLEWERDEYYISREEWFELRDTVLEKCRKHGLQTNIDDPDFDPLFFKPFDICEYPFSGYITLNYEGFVAPCCRLTQVAHMGDLKEQSFDDVWNGEPFTRLRELIIAGDYPSYCHDRCKYRVKMNEKPSAEKPGNVKWDALAQAPVPQGAGSSALLDIESVAKG